MQQSLQDIIESLPKEFVNKVLATDSVADLNDMLCLTEDDDETALIIARIANINHLVA